MDATYFTKPKQAWQRRYEALRASTVERLPAQVVAARYGYNVNYVYVLRHMFKTGKIQFEEPVGDGKVQRRRVNKETRQKICTYREQRLSASDICALLLEDGIELSIRTVERVLAEEGFGKLPRRTKLKIGITVKGANVPAQSEHITLGAVEGQQFDSDAAGIFVFAPFLEQIGLDDIIRKAKLPGSKVIPVRNYLLSFITYKLLGTERYAHVGKHSFDPGPGLFAGLNVLPKCTAMSTYSYGLDNIHIAGLQAAFVKHAKKLGLYEGKVVNLDHHTVPHFGSEPVLQKHWAGARNKRMKGALTLFAQDAESRLLLYTEADIKREDSAGCVLDFVSFWKRVYRGISPLLVFDSKFTTYDNLSRLNQEGIKFITLRQRGCKMVKYAENRPEWKRLHIPHAKRKYKYPQAYEMTTTLARYDGLLRQVIVKGNGRENPTFIVTNDFNLPLELVVGNYARRWRVENGLSEAVSFFNLNALSSPILTKVHFDVVLTMIADTIYHMLAQNLRGFEDCSAKTLFRHFIRGKGTIAIRNGEINVTYPRRAHNPILRSVPWDRLPKKVPGLPGSILNLHFR
jgi:transposase